MACIVVQHLSPTFSIAMNPCLAHCAQMTLRWVEDGMTAEASAVY
jgi:chemotaxis response regulator CheB